MGAYKLVNDGEDETKRISSSGDDEKEELATMEEGLIDSNCYNNGVGKGLSLRISTSGLKSTDGCDNKKRLASLDVFRGITVVVLI